MSRHKKYDIAYRISVYMDLELARIIQQKAWEQHKSVSQYISDILREYLGLKEQNENRVVKGVKT